MLMCGLVQLYTPVHQEWKQDKRGNKINEKMTTENLNENLSDSITEEDSLTDTAQSLKYQETAEKKGQRNSVAGKYCGYLKSNRAAEQSGLQIVSKACSQKDR